MPKKPKPAYIYRLHRGSVVVDPRNRPVENKDDERYFLPVFMVQKLKESSRIDAILFNSPGRCYHVASTLYSPRNPTLHVSLGRKTDPDDYALSVHQSVASALKTKLPTTYDLYGPIYVYSNPNGFIIKSN